MVAPDERELLHRAAGLVPVLKERAAHTEELRRVPEETVSDLLDTGLHRIGVPKRFGGLDAGYGLALDVAAELGRGCPSTSWCYGLWAAHAWLVGYWPLQAQEEVFGDSADTLLSSSLNPGKSTCEPIEGGYRLSGRWQFSSGCDHAGWVMLGAPDIGERNLGAGSSRRLRDRRHVVRVGTSRQRQQGHSHRGRFHPAPPGS